MSACGRCDAPVDDREGWSTTTITAAGAAVDIAVCPACTGPVRSTAASTGSVAGDQLRLLVERIERLEEDKKAVGDDIRDIYAEAKSRGYQSRILREVVKLRRMEHADRQERDAILDLYRSELGLT